MAGRIRIGPVVQKEADDVEVAGLGGFAQGTCVAGDLVDAIAGFDVVVEG